jgi:hypothetical protein
VNAPNVAICVNCVTSVTGATGVTGHHHQAIQAGAGARRRGRGAAQRARHLGAHYRHALALLADGSVWGWGNNVPMNLADGARVSRSVPVKVQGLSP